MTNARQETLDRYDSVNAVWPATLPAITREEATRAARKLMDHFYQRRDGGGRRWCRQVWISARPLSNGTARGWWRLVHDVSHRVFDLQNRKTFRGHSGWHAELELEMVRYVVEHGWLDGRLRTAEPAPLSVDERRVKKLAHAQRMLARWEKKSKTAAQRVKRWRGRVRDYTRYIALASARNGGG
jgi:hypothetical protein